MAVASLLRHAEGVAGARRPPLAGLPPTAGLLGALRGHQLRQFRPRAVLAAVGNWLISGGGRVTGVPGGLRLAGESPDPHVLCFGPSLDYPRRFLHCLGRAHAVVPYRVGEGRVYVYDPNHPGDRGRYVGFPDGGGFVYGGFRSEEGWGISRVPLSACRSRSRDAPDRVEWARPKIVEKTGDHMGEGSEQGGRRELLDRLAGARSGLEAADARAEADRWLDEHPDDEEVRRALGRVGSSGEDAVEGDLEEGSPT